MSEEAKRRPRRRREENNENRSSGGSNAVMIVLVVLGCMAVACVGIPIIAAIAVPNLLAAKKAANEASAIGAIRSIASAQAMYVERSDTETYAASLEDLAKVGYIEGPLAKGQREGYSFVLSARDPSFGYTATATPNSPDTGDRRFRVTQDVVIEFKVGESGQWQKLGARRRRR